MVIEESGNRSNDWLSRRQGRCPSGDQRPLEEGCAKVGDVCT